MSTNAIDINDLDRLSAERRLTENAPRALPEEEPNESFSNNLNPGIELIKTLAAMLLGRQNEQVIQ